MIRQTVALAALSCAVFFGGSKAMAAEIRVIGSPGVRGAVLALIPQFEC